MIGDDEERVGRRASEEERRWADSMDGRSSACDQRNIRIYMRRVERRADKRFSCLEAVAKRMSVRIMGAKVAAR